LGNSVATRSPVRRCSPLGKGEAGSVLGIDQGDVQRRPAETVGSLITPSRLLGDLLAAALALLCAFFGVFQMLFTDIFGMTERVQSWLYVGGLYAVAGLTLTLLWPTQRQRWRLWLGLPATLVAGRFALQEPGTAHWALAALGAAILGLLAGTAAGRRLRSPSA
jgi:hypothetical protein